MTSRAAMTTKPQPLASSRRAAPPITACVNATRGTHERSQPPRHPTSESRQQSRGLDRRGVASAVDMPCREPRRQGSHWSADGAREFGGRMSVELHAVMSRWCALVATNALVVLNSQSACVAGRKRRWNGHFVLISRAHSNHAARCGTQKPRVTGRGFVWTTGGLGRVIYSSSAKTPAV